MPRQGTFRYLEMSHYCQFMHVVLFTTNTLRHPPLISSQNHMSATTRRKRRHRSNSAMAEHVASFGKIASSGRLASIAKAASLVFAALALGGVFVFLRYAPRVPAASRPATGSAVPQRESATPSLPSSTEDTVNFE